MMCFWHEIRHGMAQVIYYIIRRMRDIHKLMLTHQPFHIVSAAGWSYSILLCSYDLHVLDVWKAIVVTP